MTKPLSKDEGAILGLETSLDLYHKLKDDSRRLGDGWHPYVAFDFVLTAWHLYNDWPKRDVGNLPSKSKRRESSLPSEMTLVLSILQDLANGSKHVRLTPDAARKRTVDTVHTGDEVGFFEFFFHEDIPGISAGHSYFSIRVLRNIVVRYFEWVFDDSVAVKDFPAEIIETIQYCDVSIPKSGPTPALWLIDVESAYTAASAG